MSYFKVFFWHCQSKVGNLLWGVHVIFLMNSTLHFHSGNLAININITDGQNPKPTGNELFISSTTVFMKVTSS